MRMGEVVLSDVDMVVVDEADRMADMGFLPAVRRILDATNAGRQTMLFSATLDDASVRPLVRNYQHQPVRHEVVSTVEEVGRATHRFRNVAAAERAAACAEVVKGETSTIVFVRTKHGADRLARQLGNSGLAVAAIHGGHSQPQRDRTLAAFRAGKVRPWSPRTWPPGEYTSMTSPASSTTTCLPTLRTTYTARAVLPGPGPRARSWPSCPPTRPRRRRRSPGRSTSTSACPGAAHRSPHRSRCAVIRPKRRRAPYTS